MKKDGSSYSPAEFNDIFRRYWDMVYDLCYRYTENTAVSKDMVQEIFITLWQRDIPLRDAISLEKYLSRAAKYQIFKRLRDTKGKTFTALNTTEENLSAGIDFDNPQQQFIYRELNEQLVAAIDRLQEPTKTIFLLNRVSLLNQKQIALRMQMTVKAVEYHLSKARKLIRKKILQ